MFPGEISQEEDEFLRGTHFHTTVSLIVNSRSQARQSKGSPALAVPGSGGNGSEPFAKRVVLCDAAIVAAVCDFSFLPWLPAAIV